MSKIEVNAIEPQSGTTLTVGASGDTVTVPSGVTLDTSNSTLTLPDNSVTTNKIADSNITLAKLSATGTKDATTFLRGDNSFAEVPAGGITEFDQWRLTANFGSNTGAVPNTNWERVDDPTFEKIGTGMSESSGIFSFSSTGKYLVNVQATTKGDGGSMLTASVTLQVTTNNSSYTTRAEGITELLDNGHGQHYFGTLVDVTDISNIKIRLGISTNANEVVLQGSTDSSKTAIFFTKLGDT